MDENNGPGSESGPDQDRTRSFANVQTASTSLQSITHGTDHQSSRQLANSTQQDLPSTTSANTTSMHSDDTGNQDSGSEKDDSGEDMDVDSETSDTDLEDDEDRSDDDTDLSPIGFSSQRDDNESNFTGSDVDEPIDEEYELSYNTMHEILNTMAAEAEVATEMFNEQQQKDLDLISKVAQAQFSRQPISTQMILTKEAANIFKEYAQHGSAARLSERLMSFLEGGDLVERRVKKMFIKMGNPGPPETGTPSFKDMPRAVEYPVREAARIKFAMLREEVEDAERRAKIKSMEKDLPAKLCVSTPFPRKIIDPRRPPNKGTVSGRVSASHIIRSDKSTASLDPRQMREWELWQKVKESEKYEVDINVPTVEEATQEYSSNNQFAHEQEEPPAPENGHANQHASSDRTTPNPPRDAYNKVTTTNNLIPPLESLAPFPAILDHDTSYTLTSDAETHALLSIPDALPFQPVDLTLSIPQGTYFPPSTLESVNHILQLYNLAAHDLLRHLTLTHTPSSPYPDSQTISPHFRTFPAPPLALFHLAVLQYFSSQVSTILSPTISHDLFMSPQTRTLLRGVYDSLQPGELNHVEAELLQRACRLGSVEAVEVFWDERNIDLKAWIALKAWRRKRQMEKIKRARLEGRFW